MIIGLSMVQSEADMIEYFARSNLRLLDHLVIVLNPSEDGTDEILYALVREGLPLTIWPTAKNIYAQSHIISYMANRIIDQFGPDYLLIIDADEILLAHDRADLKKSVSEIPTGGLGYLPWMTFIPPGNETSYVFNPHEWRYRLATEQRQFYKIALDGSCCGDQEIIIPTGQHEAFLPNGRQIPSKVLSELPLAHFPVRSLHQISTKTYSSVISKGLAQGSGWRGRESIQRDVVLDYLENNRDPDVRDIAKIYLRFENNASRDSSVVIDDRLPEIPLRYSHVIRELSPARQLFERTLRSVFDLDDPTQLLIRNKDSAQQAVDAQPNGIFSPALHAENLKCDWPPFDYVRTRFLPRSVLDVGCGLGAYLALFAAREASVHGIDGSQHSSMHFIAESQYQQVDLARQRAGLSQKYTVSIFAEVAEHLPEQCALDIIDRLTSVTTDAIVFSAAQPHQPGYGHITLREPEFWLERFQTHGWGVDLSGTLSLRALSTLHWFRRNLFLLVPGRENRKDGLQLLLKSGRHRDNSGGHQWPCHRDGERVIGFPGQRSSFNMAGSREIPPLFGAIEPLTCTQQRSDWQKRRMGARRKKWWKRPFAFLNVTDW